MLVMLVMLGAGFELSMGSLCRHDATRDPFPQESVIAQ